MKRRYTTGIKASVMLIITIGVAAMNWTRESRRAYAQTNNGQGVDVQGDKPFDQKQALAELRKKIAGQEDKPAGEVFKRLCCKNSLAAQDIVARTGSFPL